MPLPHFAPVLAVVIASVALALPTRAELAATVRLSTGEMRLTNLGEVDYTLVAYQIHFPTSDLLSDQWLHIAGLTDASITGDGSVDPTGSWLIITPTPVMDELPPTSDQLVEGTVTGLGAVLSPGERLLLGTIWNPSTPRSIEVFASDNNAPSTSIAVSYIQPGDYDENGIVDGDDYSLWKTSFGQSGDALLADGNADGVVNLADYSVWRDNLGAVALGPEVVAPLFTSSEVVPEPSTLVLAILALAGVRAVALRR
ncbi:PEP-CTERM sorting domain-containing protein [Aeoliella sp. SH292]|uniref:PEP-CTERM sorting domain-containing protein n=1 Tax=Aeoliella sp. SH292 TaxID=3454464 RepID=UPI003F9A4202